MPMKCTVVVLTVVVFSVYNLFSIIFTVVSVLFVSGLHLCVGYETNDKEKRKNNLNLHLSNCQRAYIT